MTRMLSAIAMLLGMSALQAAAPGETENMSQSQSAEQIIAIESKLLQSAQHGDAELQYLTGLWFWMKPNRSAGDLRQAAEWFQRSALKGHSGASFYIALMTALGEGIPQNLERGATMMASSAKTGHALAQRFYGMFLEGGLGVKENPTEALHWYDRATENGDQEARSLAMKLRERLAAASQVKEPFPAAPDAVPGRVTCSTRCVNGDCYRTYGDGRRAHFEAHQVWDPMQNSFVWDSSGC
jgi:TPR repeat protein